MRGEELERKEERRTEGKRRAQCLREEESRRGERVKDWRKAERGLRRGGRKREG